MLFFVVFAAFCCGHLGGNLSMLVNLVGAGSGCGDAGNYDFCRYHDNILLVVFTLTTSIGVIHTFKVQYIYIKQAAAVSHGLQR